MSEDDLRAALDAADNGSVSEQMGAATVLVANLSDGRAADAVLSLLRHQSNLGPICEASRVLLADGTDAALRLFAIAYHQTKVAEDWQSADCLNDEAREARGSGAVEVHRWRVLMNDPDPVVSSGATSVWEWFGASA